MTESTILMLEAAHKHAWHDIFEFVPQLTASLNLLTRAVKLQAKDLLTVLKNSNQNLVLFHKHGQSMALTIFAGEKASVAVTLYLLLDPVRLVVRFQV